MILSKEGFTKHFRQGNHGWGPVFAYTLVGSFILAEILIVGLTCFILWKKVLKPIYFEQLKPFFKKLSR